MYVLPSLTRFKESNLLKHPLILVHESGVVGKRVINFSYFEGMYHLQNM
jgi:hypothetical protein